MVRPFTYRIVGTIPKLKVQISQESWPRVVKALAWSAIWGTLAYLSLRSTTTWSVAVLVVAAILCLVGLLVANYAVQWSTLWLASDTLRLRIVRLFTRKTRSFPIHTIRDFGFGWFSHNGPVLRLDVEGSWIVLAQNVREDQVGEFLVKIQQSGYTFPDKTELSRRHSAPRFWTFD